MKNSFLTKRKVNILLILLAIILFVSGVFILNVRADEDSEENEYIKAAEARKSGTVQTNEIEGWPDGPAIGAEAAVLMNAETGQILYAKNMDEQLFPASTTKIMTCVVALENAALTDVITINQSAIDANDPDGSNMGLYAGEKLTLEELLHGVLISSANEACNAIGQHVAGDIDGYVALMNKKAEELGCRNTHFMSTNGLANPEHYTSAYDLALIGREFFKYDILCKLSSIGMYDIPETADHRAHSLYSKNKLYKGRTHEYPYLVGSKTGFTSDSRQTLVSCAEKDGVKLIATVLKEESPNQFQDTIDLFEYGFNNFSRVNIANNEKRYSISGSDSFGSYDAFFKSAVPEVVIDSDSYVLLPSSLKLEDLESTLIYKKDASIYSANRNFGDITYSYKGFYMGSAGIALTYNMADVSGGGQVIRASHGKMISKGVSSDPDNKQIIVNVVKLVINAFILLAIIVVLVFGYGIFIKIHDRNKHLRNIKKTRNTESAAHRRRTVLKRASQAQKERSQRLKNHKRPETENGFSKPKPRSVYKPPIVSTLFDGNKNNKKRGGLESIGRVGDRRPPSKKRSHKVKDFDLNDF